MADKIKLVLEGDASGLKAALQEATGGLNGVEGKTKSATASFLKFASVTAAAGAVGLALKGSIAITAKFQSAISDLSAITGASGKDLEFLSDKAKEMGATTTKSASEAAEAMKLMASAKPDLLENAAALASVTKEALTLSEAAGSTLPEAANTLGSSLNQFAAGADQAGRFINVLAAGAKEGASEIRETAAALKETGTVANDAGISFEATNAAIQTLSTVAIKGGQAGTNLRNVILKLQNQTEDGFNPAVVGLEAALKNLQTANLDTTELTKLFGLESVTAAKTLISQADSVGVLTQKLTDTNTAYDQAATKTDNMTGDMAALTSAVEAAAIEFGEELAPVIRFTLQTATSAIQELLPVVSYIGKNFAMAFQIAEVAGLGFISALLTGFDELQQAASDVAEWLGFDVEPSDTLEKWANDSRLALVDANAELGNLVDNWNTPPAAVNIATSIAEDVKAAKKAIAEPVATEAAATAKKEDPSIQAEIDAQAAKYMKLRQMAEQFQLGEEEREVLRYERENEQFNLDLERLIENGATVDEVLEMQRQARADAEAIHQDKLTTIEANALKQKLQQEKFVADQKLGVTADLLGATSSLLMQGNKSQFEAGKKLAVAQTLISTYQGAQQAFTSLSSIPIVGSVLGAIAAAAAIAAGLSRISSIKSQKYSQAHSGLDRNPSEGTFLLKRNEMVLDSGTSEAVRQAAPALAGGGGGGEVNLTININSPMFEPDWDDMIENRIKPAFDRLFNRDVFLEGVVYG